MEENKVSNEENVDIKRNETEFIQNFGFDKIMQLDKETDGIFSHKINNPNVPNCMFMTVFANKYENTKEEYPQVDGVQMSYENFKERIYEYLVDLKNEGVFRNKNIVGDMEDYDFIRGGFRNEHPEIFINEEIDPELKSKYYKGLIKAEDIKNNNTLYEILKDKRVDDIFKERMSNAYQLKEISQEDFLNLCKEYGKYLDNDKVIKRINNLKYKDSSYNQIKTKIDSALHELIKENAIQYGEDLPMTFKHEYEELFLPENVVETIRNKFSTGKMTFEDVRQNPELEDILINKDLEVGFRAIREGKFQNSIFKKKHENSKIEENFENFSKEKILELAKQYGKYLEVIDCDIFNDVNGFEAKKSVIEKEIEEKILSKEMVYDNTVPKFFSDKYPRLMLSERAPEELKTCFYDGFKMNFKKLKDNPSWKKYLLNKDLSRAFPEKFGTLIKMLENNNDKLIKIGISNLKAVDTMVDNHQEATLKTWYEATGGKFVPSATVMLNTPENEIDKFLTNSKKWLKNIRNNETISEDDKVNILYNVYHEDEKNNYVQYEQQDNAEYNKILEEAKNKSYSSIPEIDIAEIVDPTDFSSSVEKIGVLTGENKKERVQKNNAPRKVENNIEKEIEKNTVNISKEIDNNTFNINEEVENIAENINLDEKKEKVQNIKENKIVENNSESANISNNNDNKVHKIIKNTQNQEDEEIVIPKEIKRKPFERFRVHDDSIPEYDGNSMRRMALRMMKRMERSKGKNRLSLLTEQAEDLKLPESKKMINSIAREYNLDPETTKVILSDVMALIYCKENGDIKIGDLFTAPTLNTAAENLNYWTEDYNEEIAKEEEKIMERVKKALVQIGAVDSKIDGSELEEDQRQMIKTAIQEIKAENLNNRRGES